MADIKEAVVTRVLRQTTCETLLECQPTVPSAIEFVGGQYVIVHTGRIGPDGRPLKRSYSLLPSTENSRGFCLAIEKVPGGRAREWTTEVIAGSFLRFSGPWGKKSLPERMGNALLVGVDTGITGALAMAARITKGSPRVAVQGVRLWAQQSDFFTEGPVWGLYSRADWNEMYIGEVGNIQRAEVASNAVVSALDALPDFAFLAGDGAVLGEIANRLVSLGVSSSQVVVDNYFNKPARV